MNTYLNKKVILLFLVAIASQLFFSTAVRAEKWLLYSNIMDLCYYDRDSIKIISHNTITVWTKTNFRQDATDFFRAVNIEYEKSLKKEGKENPFKKRKVQDSDIVSQKLLMEIQCDRGSYKYKHLIMLNKTGEIVSDSNDYPDYKKMEDETSRNINNFEPDAPIHTLFKGACSHAFK